MAFQYAFNCDRSTLSALSNEDGILPGELVFTVSGGGVRRATGTDGRVDGVVEDFVDAHSAQHPYDHRSDIDQFTYDTGDMVKFAGDEQNARLRVRTPADAGDPAPNITEWSVVGIPDIVGMEGRVVEEGYSPDGGTTIYERGAGNFTAVGVARGNADNVPATGFNDLVTVVRKVNL